MRILSISGGGFQALYGVLLLEDLETSIGPLKNSFDLVCGSSAGAILASAVVLGLPMAELREGFISRGSEVFHRRRTGGARDLLRRFRSSRYESGPLRVLVSEITGETTLGETNGKLAMTAARLHDGAAIVFEGHGWPDILVRDAVMASTAAPTMFPAVRIGGHLHADGAIFANAPDLLALDLALRRGAEAASLSMLSIGSMNACPPLGEPRDADMGVIDWIRGNRIFRTMIGAQAEMTNRVMQGLLGDRYTRLDAAADFPLRHAVALDKADPEAVLATRQAAELSRGALDRWIAGSEGGSLLVGSP